VRHASHTRTETDNLLVRCTLADGTVGHGEGVPREYVTGETIESALSHLKISKIPAQLTPCQSFESAVALAERLELAALPDDERRCKGNGARCAVELALLDAYGRHFRRPLSDVTRLLAPEMYEPKAKVQYSGAITSAKGWKARFNAWLMRLYGFSHVKIKVGIEGHDDVARLRSIRSRIGKKMDLRIDANEAWTPANAARRILELREFGITSVEQPVPHEQVAALSAIRADVSVPIMLDESLCSMVDAERAAADGWCDLFNLRLSKVGGYTRALRLAQFARTHGLGYQLGCQVGETAVLSAAGRHFATSVAGLRYLEGSYDKHLVREALSKRDISFGWGGWAPALVEPGLGIEIDPAAVERVRVCEEVLLG
jgi:muconate cycloisomerase